MDVGTVVDIKGSIALFRDEKTVKIEKVRMLRSTEEEVALWERRMAFRRDVLARPWVLSEKQVRRCRREAEGMDERNRKRQEKEERERRAARREREGTTRGNKFSMDEGSGKVTAAVVEVDGFGRPKRQKDSQTLGGHRYKLSTRIKSGERSSSRVELGENKRGKYSALGL